MNQDETALTDKRGSLNLKLLEPEVSPKQPWRDDVLNREQIATRLTNLIRHEALPLVISIHGQWGTGKTFMLKRWQQDLQNQGFNAIYFNAWEDDFCDDPLLAIIGQLASYFSKGRFKEGVDRVTSSAIPLFRSNVSSVLTHLTGATTEFEHNTPTKNDLIKQYHLQRHGKDLLNKELEKLSAAVYSERNQPLVFIIDELDRCRPTFAIELLERVKHIFDVPNMVFVLGINRDELCNALSSVYGDIGTDVYLRRFFDFEFNLPEVDSRKFAEHLISKYQLDKAADTTIDSRQLQIHGRVFPQLWSALSLSLRDVDYGIRLVAILVKSAPAGTFIHPYLLALLIAMKFKKPEFYSSLKSGDFETKDIMDYINDECRRDLVDEQLTRDLDRIEGFLYCADSENRHDQQRGENAETELGRLQIADVEFGFEVISHRARNAEPQQILDILQGIRHGRESYIDGQVFGNIAMLIDTHQLQLRR